MRTVFAFKGGNCEDYVKNFSFLMNRKGEWRLSPTYDITFAYNPDNRWISRHQMSINGKTSGITDDDLMRFGKTIGLSAEFCRKTIARTDDVVSRWLEYAAKSGISDERAVEIKISISSPQMN